MASHQSSGMEFATLFAGNCAPMACDCALAAMFWGESSQRFLAPERVGGAPAVEPIGQPREQSGSV